MKKLDTILKDQKISADGYDHWVIDLQGAELLALKGSEKSLQYCKSMSVEVSTVDIYDGGVVRDELCYWLKKKIFIQIQNLKKIMPMFFSLKNNN